MGVPAALALETGSGSPFSVAQIPTQGHRTDTGFRHVYLPCVPGEPQSTYGIRPGFGLTVRKVRFTQECHRDHPRSHTGRSSRCRHHAVSPASCGPRAWQRGGNISFSSYTAFTQLYSLKNPTTTCARLVNRSPPHWQPTGGRSVPSEEAFWAINPKSIFKIGVHPIR